MLVTTIHKLLSTLLLLVDGSLDYFCAIGEATGSDLTYLATPYHGTFYDSVLTMSAQTHSAVTSFLSPLHGSLLI